MKVSELIEALQKCDPECEVYLSRDEEGNGFSPLCDVDGGIICTKGEWGMNVYYPDWSADEANMDVDEWDTLKAGPRSVVLWPLY